MNTHLEDDLRAMLAERAASVPLAADPWARTKDVAIRYRRRRMGIASLASAALAVAVSVPLAVALHAGAGGTAKASPPPVPAVSIVEWPVGGNLAGDPEAVAWARSELRVVARSDGAIGAQVLAVASVSGNQIGAGLVRLGESHPPEQEFYLTVFSRFGGTYTPLDKDDLDRRAFLARVMLGGAQVSSERDHLVVIAGPGIDRVEVSAVPRFDANGRVARSYVEMPLDQRVATLRLVNPAAPVRVHAFHGNDLVVDEVLRGRGAIDTPIDPNAIARLAHALGVAPDEIVQEGLRELTFGQDLRGARFRAVWRHAYPGGGLVGAAVVELRLVTGAALQLVFVQGRSKSFFPMEARLVPKANAARLPIAWLEEAAEKRMCMLRVAVPAAGSRGVQVTYDPTSSGGRPRVDEIGEAGGLITFDFCSDLKGTGRDLDHGVLVVADRSTGAELLRWDLSRPRWQYERTDTPTPE